MLTPSSVEASITISLWGLFDDKEFPFKDTLGELNS
jgi:hypothetical protein